SRRPTSRTSHRLKLGARHSSATLPQALPDPKTMSGTECRARLFDFQRRQRQDVRARIDDSVTLLVEPATGLVQLGEDADRPDQMAALGEGARLLGER